MNCSNRAKRTGTCGSYLQVREDGENKIAIFGIALYQLRNGHEHAKGFRLGALSQLGHNFRERLAERGRYVQEIQRCRIGNGQNEYVFGNGICDTQKIGRLTQMR